ncbi:unnamed protein product [Sympodiomycopsis kandeliae]
MSSAQFSTRPTPAAIIPLSDLRREHVGSKVRIAGFITAIDEDKSKAIIAYKESSLIIDYSLCLSEESIRDRQDSLTPRGKEYRTGLPILKYKMIVMGDLIGADDSEDELRTSTLADPLPGITLQATLIKEAINLDMSIWETAARTESQSRWEEIARRQSKQQRK